MMQFLDGSRRKDQACGGSSAHDHAHEIAGEIKNGGPRFSLGQGNGRGEMRYAEVAVFLMGLGACDHSQGEGGLLAPRQAHAHDGRELGGIGERGGRQEERPLRSHGTVPTGTDFEEGHAAAGVDGDRGRRAFPGPLGNGDLTPGKNEFGERADGSRGIDLESGPVHLSALVTASHADEGT